MQSANIFLAHQRVLEARHQAAEARVARLVRHRRLPRTPLGRIRGEH
jgi:hypothetical protein